MQIQFIIRGADERLSEVHGIFHDLDDREPITMPNPMLGQRRRVAAGKSIAPDIAFFEVGDCNG